MFNSIDPSAGCWGKKNASSEAINFSAIIASEKKQKTMVQKETKKLETKPLHLTQVIQFLKSYFQN